MLRGRLLGYVLLLLTGAIPLVTMGTCYNTGTAFGYDLFSTNDNLVNDVVDWLGGDDDDD